MAEMSTSFVRSELKTSNWPKLQRVMSAIAGSCAVVLTLWSAPGLADPFRSANPRNIDDQTELAFDQIFKEGDYQAARATLSDVSANEPLAYAMRASMAYLDEDWEAMGQNATLTREAAENLISSDPLRGHLYVAAGLFLEGAYTLSTEGIVSATPSVLGKLQQVFSALGEAEKIDPADPELNLLKGYMDLMLAVNLPFSDPNQAIQRLQSYAAPAYLAQRGIAIGYRDLQEPEKAMTAVDQALQETPDNPDLYYLKAQILVKQGQERESLEYFARALEKQSQLPRNLANQIAWEECRTSNRVNNTDESCAALIDD